MKDNVSTKTIERWENRDKMKLVLKELDLPFYDPLLIIENKSYAIFKRKSVKIAIFVKKW